MGCVGQIKHRPLSIQPSGDRQSFWTPLFGSAMSITSLALVNQKLAYARSLLALAPVIDTTTGSAKRLESRALIDGAVGHLVCACRHYLYEIAERNRLKMHSPILTETDLVTRLIAAGSAPTDAAEIVDLRVDKSSWFSRLHHYYEGRWYEKHWQAPPAPQEKAAATDAMLINVVTLDGDSDNEPNAADVNAWYDAFVVLIQRQRETGAEY